MAANGYALGIDFGTSNTVAVLRWPDGQIKPLLFDGSPLLRSGVYAAEAGDVLVGRDAQHSAQQHPDRFEPNPKRRVDEAAVWLGDRESTVSSLIAGVLRRVYDEARRVAGTPDLPTAITHPAAWGATRRGVLLAAAEAAGLHDPALVAEPIAAGAFFVRRIGVQLPIGDNLLVYDFGGGTFDASVVRRTDTGFEVRSSEGLDDTGGLDIDAAIVANVGRTVSARAPEVWQRLTQPNTDTDRRAAMQLWEDVRQAKELLSRSASTMIQIPILDEAVPLGREELNQLMRPILDRTITATQVALANAGLDASRAEDRDKLSVLLVGGSSRIPLVATMLHAALGISPVALEQPELVVAEGSLPATAKFSASARIPDPPKIIPLPPVTATTPTPLPPPVQTVLPAAAATPPVSSAPPVTSAPPVSYPPAPSYPAPQHYPTAQQPFPPFPTSGPPQSPAGPYPGTSPYPTARPPITPQGIAYGGQQTRRRWPLIATIVVFVLLVPVVVVGVVKVLGDGDEPGGGGGTSGPIVPACDLKVGFFGVLSGDAKSYGEAVRDGAQLALEEYNQAHADCKAELVDYDTEGEPDPAVSKAKDAIKDEKIIGVVGPLWPRETSQAGGEFNAAGLPMISPVVSNTDLSTKGWKTFHRITGTDAAQARAMGKKLAEDSSVSLIYYVDDGSDIGSEFTREVRSAVGSAKFAGTATVSSSTNYASIATEIAGSSANAVYFGGYATPAANLVKALKTAGVTAAVYGGSPAFDGAFIDKAGDAASVLTVTCACVPPEKAGNKFDERFRDRYNRGPTYGSAEAYDAINVFLDGFQAGSNTRDKMLAFVNGYDKDGVSGRVKFTDKGEPAGNTGQIWTYKVEGTSFEYIQQLSL